MTCHTARMDFGELFQYPFLASVWGTASTVIGTAVTAGSAAVAAQVYRHSKKVDEYSQARQLRVYVTSVFGEFRVEMYNHSEHPIYAMQLYGTKRPIEEILDDPLVHVQFREINKKSDGLMHDDDRLAIINEWLEYNNHFSTFDETYDFLKPSADEPSTIVAVGRLAIYYDYRIRFKDSRSLKWYFDIPREMGEIADTEPKPDLARRTIGRFDIPSHWQIRSDKRKLEKQFKESKLFAKYTTESVNVAGKN